MKGRLVPRPDLPYIDRKDLSAQSMVNSQSWANSQTLSLHTVVYSALWNAHSEDRWWKHENSDFTIAVAEAKDRQCESRTRAFPHCVIFIRLDAEDANRTMPICVMDPRVCVVAPRLWAELNSSGALGLDKTADYSSHVFSICRGNSYPLCQRVARTDVPAHTDPATKTLLELLNYEALPRPYAINDYWATKDHNLNLLRFAEVPLETTVDGRTFNPPSSMRHVPLLCITDATDALRNLMDWMDTMVRGLAGASILQGNKGQAQQFENEQSFFTDSGGNIVPDYKLKDVARLFATVLHETDDIQMPASANITIGAFLRKFSTKYCCMCDYNAPDIIHAHIISEYYRTRLMSNADEGYFIGSHGDVEGEWACVKAASHEVLSPSPSDSARSHDPAAAHSKSNPPQPPTKTMPLRPPVFQHYNRQDWYHSLPEAWQ